MSGLTNKYSASLLGLMGLLVCLGALALFNGSLWGFIPLILGGLMIKGFRELSPADPREIGLITFLGKRTTITVEGLTFLLDWLPIEIVGVAVFSMQQEDMDFDIKSVRSSDNVRMKGTVSISFIPDKNNLDKFDDAKQMKGIEALIDDMLPVWIQNYAQNDQSNGPKLGHDYAWLETRPKEVGKYLREKLENKDTTDGDTLDLADLGVLIKKFSVSLSPISTKIVDAGEDTVVELLQRNAEKEDTKTVTEQAENRHEAYVKKMGSKAPTLRECREEIMFERLAKDKKVTIIQGGKNVNLNNVGNTD
jgi:hypothetical protein